MNSIIKNTTLFALLSFGAAQADTVIVSGNLTNFDGTQILDTLEVTLEVPSTTEVESGDGFASSFFFAESVTVFSELDGSSTFFDGFDPDDLVGLEASASEGEGDEFGDALGAVDFVVTFPLPALSALGSDAPTLFASYINSYFPLDGAATAPFVTGEISSLEALDPSFEIPGFESFPLGQTFDPSDFGPGPAPGENSDEIVFEVTNVVIIADDNAGAGAGAGSGANDDRRARRDRREREDRPRRERRERR